ncbi:hypothetical protein JCM10212_006744 [Sporobolomyces blumeae]
MTRSTFLATALCAALVAASPVKRADSSSASSGSPTITSAASLSSASASSSTDSIGLSVSDTYPPVNTLPNTSLFPDESQVGYQQPTPTGVEPFAAQTAVSWPVRGDIFPLRVSSPAESGSSSNGTSSFEPNKYWGNLSPAFSVPSSHYGLDSASPVVPDTCNLVQAHIYFRHGARYPTTGSAPSEFADKLHNASLVGPIDATGELEFLNEWTYKLGAELLTPFGRKQNFELGVEARNVYGGLLNNFTEQGTLPVFRTQSQDRMVKTMLNFVAGMFGVPEYQDQVNVEIGIEAPGFINSGAPYESCPNEYSTPGSKAAVKFAEPYFNKTAARLNSKIGGNLTLTASDITSMAQLCAYESVALGYSSFCPLFTEEEFRVFEHAYDIQFHGNNGFGSPVAAAQGLGYLQELTSRLQHQLITNFSMEVNQTLDGNTQTFPLNQSIYADAAHEVSIMNALVALNLTSLVKSGAPSATALEDATFRASYVVPFATNLQIQVLECSSYSPTKQIRFIVNDAVIPLTYEGCDPTEKNGLCAYDKVVSALVNRIGEIDFSYDCTGNWTVPAYGSVSNGRVGH